MTIRAPFATDHTPYPRPHSYEREVFFETLGACWALSARNISGQFPLQLQLDLSRLTLLYGTPAVDLQPVDFFRFLHAFQRRPNPGHHISYSGLELQALLLIDDMTEADFLNFSTGMADAVAQILSQMDCWGQECQLAFMALKYYGLNLIETNLQDPAIKRTYADLLCQFLTCTQNAYRSEITISHLLS